MNKQWILTNRDIVQPDGLEVVFKTDKFNLYGPKNLIIEYKEQDKTELPMFFVDGFVLPRYTDFQKNSKLDQKNLLPELYKMYGIEFINHIKGNFILVMIHKSEFYVFTDRLGIKKCYYHNTEDGKYIISNTLKFISDNIRTELDKENIAIKILMHYYIGGGTFLKNIFCTIGASKISFVDTLIIESYWHCRTLLEQASEETTYKNFALRFKDIVKSYISFLKPAKTSVTLTGGLDSRTVLSVLLALNEKPSTYTYGKPESGDVISAKHISEICGLEFKNHPYPQLSSDWFKQLAEEITIKGNSTINIHRAHRLFAMKQGADSFNEDEILIGGFLGGENIRGIFYDNLIVSEFLWKSLNGEKNKKQLIINILSKNYFDINQINIDIVLERLEKTEIFFNKKTAKQNKKDTGDSISIDEQFYTLYLLEAQYHHAQDLNLYSHFIKYPVPIFMDIDFLELLYKAEFDFRFINSGSNTLLKGIKGHELNCQLISELAPQLGEIPFLKRGFFSAQEYLGNKCMLLAKRIFRKFFAKNIVPNFPLDEWMKKYVEEMLYSKDIDLVRGVYNINKLQEHFANTEEYEKNEAFWQTYTMPIALALANKQYMQF